MAAPVIDKGWYRCTNKAEVLDDKGKETGEFVCPNAQTPFEVKTADVGLLCGCEHRFESTPKPKDR